MFRARGKPDDPINIKVAQQHKLLSDAIQINPLIQPADTTNDKQRELQRRRQHFDEFRETYQERLQKYQKRPWCGTTGRTSEFSLGNLFAESVKTEPINERKPVFVKAPIRTVTVEIPLIAQQNAIWCPGKVNSTSATYIRKPAKKVQLNKTPSEKETCEILRTLNELEREKRKVDRKDSSTQMEVLKEIEEVNEEIDIAELQLKQINSLIESKKQTAARESQTEQSEPKPQKSSTTWMVEHGAKSEFTGAKRLAHTLSVLSRRLQDMQDKFKSKTTYKSIKDYLSTRQSVEVIYKNRNFKSKPKIKESNTEEADRLLQIIKHHQSPQRTASLGRPTETRISPTVQPKDEIAPPKKKSSVVAENDDEMSGYFEADLLKTIMRSQFLQKEFREEMNKMEEEQNVRVNAVYTSADLMRS